MDGYILILDQQMLINLAWQLLNTLIMCAILTYLLYKPVLQFMQKRKDRIAVNIATAEGKLADADKLKLEYEKKLSNIESERNEILDAAKKRASLREQQIIAEAKEEAETLRNRAKLDITREQEKAKDYIKTQIIEISSLMTSRYVASVIDENKQNQLLEEIISDLGDAKWLS